MRLFVIFGLFGLLLFTGCCGPLSNSGIGSEEKKCTTIPYTDKECDYVSFKYTKSNDTCQSEGWLGDWVVSSCTITNLDEEAGQFSAYAGIDINGQKIGENQSAYIYPQQSHTFEYKLQANGAGCYCYETSVPQKQVCRDVIKTKEVCE